MPLRPARVLAEMICRTGRVTVLPREDGWFVDLSTLSLANEFPATRSDAAGITASQRCPSTGCPNRPLLPPPRAFAQRRDVPRPGDTPPPGPASDVTVRA